MFLSYFVDFFLTFFTFTYIQYINRILKGDVQFNLKTNDILKKAAYQRYLALKGKNKKVKMIKLLA